MWGAHKPLFFLFQEMIRNEGSEFGRLNHAFARQKQFAVGKEMRRRICLEGVGLLDFAASARDVHFCLADFDVGKFGGDFFEDRIVGLAGLTGGEAIGHDRTGAVGEFLVIVVADVENRT